MNFENKRISINFLKITIFFVIIKAIVQYILILLVLNNYNKIISQQFIFLFIKLIKNQLYKKINSYLNFFNRFFRSIIIMLLEVLINRKSNIFIIKCLFRLLKSYN